MLSSVKPNIYFKNTNSYALKCNPLKSTHKSIFILGLHREEAVWNVFTLTYMLFSIRLFCQHHSYTLITSLTVSYVYSQFN